jgi:hypothetical protein
MTMIDASKYDPSQDDLKTIYHTLAADLGVRGTLREIPKDLYSTLMAFFFGKGAGGAEPGTPYNPLFTDLVAARDYHRSFLDNAPHGGGRTIPMEPNQPVPSVAQILDNPGAYLPPGMAQAQQLAESVTQGTGTALEPAPAKAGGQQQANANDSGQAPAMDTGQTGGIAPAKPEVPSVSQILDNPQAFLAAGQQQLGQQHQHGMSMGM